MHPDTPHTRVAPQVSFVELSVVMPCYNEAEGIERLIREWVEYLTEELKSFEIIAINDGSSDGTGRILDRLRRELPSLRVFHQLNAGLGRAVRRGYEAARGDYILQVDANGRHEPNDFGEMWQKRNDAFLILGYRTHRLDSFVRRSFSLILRRWIRLIFGFDLVDANNSFRLLKREVAMATLSKIPEFRNCINFLHSIVVRRDFPDHVLELPVPFRPRLWGKSHQGPLPFLMSGLRYLVESASLKLR